MKSKLHWEICCNLLEADLLHIYRQLFVFLTSVVPANVKILHKTKIFFFLPVLIPVRVTSIHPHFLLKKQEACVVGMEKQAGMPR